MEFTSEVRKATEPIYQKISKILPEIEWPTHAPYIHKINKLKIGIFHEPENIEEFIFRYPETSVIFHGHTHKYRNEVINSTLVINPGESAGMIEGLNAIGLFNTTSKEFKRIRF